MYYVIVTLIQCAQDNAAEAESDGKPAEGAVLLRRRPPRLECVCILYNVSVTLIQCAQDNAAEAEFNKWHTPMV